MLQARFKNKLVLLCLRSERRDLRVGDESRDTIALAQPATTDEKR
jgi:hypothetical protein